MAKQAKIRAGKNGNVPPAQHQFKPGESGNPKGRPTGTSLTAIIKRVLAEKDGEGAERLIAVAVRQAHKGDFRFWNALIERNEGKVADHISADGKLTVEVVYVDAPNPTDAE